MTDTAPRFTVHTASESIHDTQTGLVAPFGASLLLLTIGDTLDGVAAFLNENPTEAAGFIWVPLDAVADV